ncbi:acriflavin resistance protein [Klebsiella pneumoniae]|nr:acriflavin resistance protein [Klebsiella pneumoniae]
MPNSCAGSWCWCRGSVKSLSAASFRSRSMWISRWRRWRRAGSPSTSSPAILARLNVVSSAGEIRVGSESIRLHPTGEFQSIDELGDLLVSPHGASATTRLRDIATLSRGANRLAGQYLSCQRAPGGDHGSFFIPGVNVIDVGHALEARLQQMAADKPAGIDIAIFYDQAAEVAHSVNGFITNFLMALAIVVGVLLVFMGVAQRDYYCSVAGAQRSRHPVIMYIWGIELQRISLGALIIALSMLVDNAIVIVEGVLIARQQGSPLLGAINYVIRRSALPLLGATIIAILAFAPIGLSQDSTGGVLQIAVPGAADLPDAELVFRSDHHPGAY